MKLHALVFPLLVLSFLITSCAKSGQHNLAHDESAVIDAVQLSALPDPDIYSDGKALLIKTAHVRFQVANVRESTTAIEAAIRKYPAYISTSSLTLSNPILENKMTIRVQYDYFQGLLKEIDTQAVFVNFRNVGTDDVSKEMVDLESRLKTKREVEQRYREILRKKAGTIEELLAAEEKIGALQEEIEAAIGKMNFLRDQVRYSSIHLEFYETITETIAKNPNDNTSARFGTAVHAGWNGIIGLAIALAYLWPLFGLTGIVYGIWWFANNKKSKAPVI